MSGDTDLRDSTLYFNRELSWLAFNGRVLEEARDPSLPLYERLKFLGIFTANLDEFYMVRVAGLKQQIAAGVTDTPADGMLPSAQVAAITAEVRRQVAEQYRIWNETVHPEIREAGHRILPATELEPHQREAAREEFRERVFPALTPLAVDPGHPFPHLRNKSLNLALALRQPEPAGRATGAELTFAVVEVPGIFSRLVPLPADGAQRSWILLEELIRLHAEELFPGYTVRQCTAFRVTRNWDLSIDEEEAEDLLSAVEEELRLRDRGAAVRLEVGGDAPPDMTRMLTGSLNLAPADVFRIPGPLQIDDLDALARADPRPGLKVTPQPPVTPRVFSEGEPVREAIDRGDVLLHHPYESFEPVVRFVEEAADDPEVLAIKQTLYRTNIGLPIVRALSRAAQNGKQVAALVEIKARFEEERNIAWGRRLEESGVHVAYGVVGLKTHCKVALVVRREAGGIRRYVHLGTGNYNTETARQYTDLSLFTARRAFADDASALLNLLTGYSRAPRWQRLAVAPFDLHERILSHIRCETAEARAGRPARIRAKMNALVDPAVIRALYEASRAGVPVDLLVRGICCLRPGVEGVSEGIRVYSIVDRYLEHSRVFAFGPDERAEVYLSSADWMPRNFFHRVEAMVPVEDEQIRHRLLAEVLELAFADNVKKRELRPDGTYAPPAGGSPPFQSQSALYERARRHAEARGVEKLRRPPAPLLKEDSRSR